MKRFFLAAAASLALASPANAYWVGNGTTTTETNRFTGSTTTTYNAKRGDCGVTKSVKAEIAGCIDINTDGRRSIMLTTTSNGWEVMYYRNSTRHANVILKHKNGKTETTTLPATFRGDTIRGGLVMETVIVNNVPLSVVSAEVQYGAVEYWYNPQGNRSSIKRTGNTSKIVSSDVCVAYGEMCKSLGL